MDKKIRVLIAKPGLDGHDRGAKVVANSLRDAGMEVIYTGLRQTPEKIVETSIQEDVDVVGLSVLSGAHNVLVEKVTNLMIEQDITDVLLIVGGIIPQADHDTLKKMGVDAIFSPGSTTQDIVQFIKDKVRKNN